MRASSFEWVESKIIQDVILNQNKKKRNEEMIVNFI